MATRNITPRADGEGSLGTAAKRWNEAHIGTMHGALDGNAATATKALQDISGRKIDDTYAEAAAIAESTGYGIVSGCELSISGMTVTVAPGIVHTADGRRLKIEQQTIILDAADATNPRVDTIYLDASGLIQKTTGTPAVTPAGSAVPDVSVKLGEVRIEANATTGTIVKNKAKYAIPAIYFQNVEEMKKETTLKAGMVARTLGYYEPNDGGGATYHIQAVEPADYAEKLENGLFAEIIMDNVANVKKFGAKGDGVTDDTENIKRAVSIVNKVRGELFFPSGTYLLKEGTVLERGVNVRGKANAFYQDGTNGLSILKVEGLRAGNTLFLLRGSNHIENIGIFYADQTYKADTMVDVGVTFEAKIADDRKNCKGIYLKGCSVCGGTTVFRTTEISDYLLLEKISFTPNYLAPSIIIGQSYDTGACTEIHSNTNLCWMYGTTYSEAILGKIYDNSQMFLFGRVDGHHFSNIIAYGSAYPITWTKISGNPNTEGGSSWSNCIFDNCRQMIRFIHSESEPDTSIHVMNFGNMFNNINVTFVIERSDNCLVYFGPKSAGCRVHITNAYIWGSAKHYEMLADKESESNRCIMINYAEAGKLNLGSVDNNENKNNIFTSFGGLNGEDALNISIMSDIKRYGVLTLDKQQLNLGGNKADFYMVFVTAYGNKGERYQGMFLAFVAEKVANIEWLYKNEKLIDATTVNFQVKIDGMIITCSCNYSFKVKSIAIY